MERLQRLQSTAKQTALATEGALKQAVWQLQQQRERQLPTSGTGAAAAASAHATSSSEPALPVPPPTPTVEAAAAPALGDGTSRHGAADAPLQHNHDGNGARVAASASASRDAQEGAALGIYLGAQAWWLQLAEAVRKAGAVSSGSGRAAAISNSTEGECLAFIVAMQSVHLNSPCGAFSLTVDATVDVMDHHHIIMVVRAPRSSRRADSRGGAIAAGAT
jgi:hypothetical protein